MNPKISISGRNIGVEHFPYVIAEVSANHNGKLETAMKIIEAAKMAGADAVKLQTYRPDTITLNCDTEDFRSMGVCGMAARFTNCTKKPTCPGNGTHLCLRMRGKLASPLFSSPFDNTAVDLLEDLNAPAYKIASFEAVDLPLIKYVASTGKPMIISTGMADAEEIQEAIDAAREGGCKELAILHCVSGYPAPAEDYNLRTIPDMIQRFGLVTGLVRPHPGQHDGHHQRGHGGQRSLKSTSRWIEVVAGRTIASRWNHLSWLRCARAPERLGRRLARSTTLASPVNREM